MSCCGQVVTPYMTRIKKGQALVECKVDHILYEDTVTTGDTYTVPYTGYHIIILAATGGEVSNYLNRPYGVEFGIRWMEKGDKVKFSLGDKATLDHKGWTLSSVKGDKSNQLQSCVVFQYLGSVLVNAHKTRKGFGGWASNGGNIVKDWVGASESITATIPDPADIKWDSIASSEYYWTVAKVNFPVDGVYRIATYGDDTSAALLDGHPVVWNRAPDNSRKVGTNPTSAGGYTDIEVKAGEHEVWFWNMNTACCQIYTFPAIKTPSGDVIGTPDTTSYKYVRTPTGCLNDILQ